MEILQPPEVENEEKQKQLLLFERNDPKCIQLNLTRCKIEMEGYRWLSEILQFNTILRNLNLSCIFYTS